LARLTKAEAKAHAEAELLLKKPRWDDDDRLFFTQNWQESANHVNSAAGAFFTPLDLAVDFAMEVGGGALVDLCAGIGTLTYAVTYRQRYSQYAKATYLVCIELNPAYVEIGKLMVPDAQWICGNVFEELPKLRSRFSTAISNPPFGNIKAAGGSPRYTGSKFEYKVIDLAADFADAGAFIVPAMSAPFKYSGRPFFDQSEQLPEYQKFVKQTGIELCSGIGIDTTLYSQWHGVNPSTEVVVTDFSERVNPGLQPVSVCAPAQIIDVPGDEPDLDTLF